MEIKEVKTKTVFYKSLKSTLQTLTSDVGNLPNDLRDELTKLGLEPAGPQEWVYIGADGNPNTEFILDICFPVEKAIEGNSMFKTLEAKKCAVEMHNGPWANLGATYEKIMGGVMSKGEQMSSTCREVYHVCDFENEANNVTEVMVELV